LAFSTVSQIAYIVLGVAMSGPIATVGGLAHLVHQGIMKITLFFCAGVFAEVLGVRRIAELDGIGRKMPGTMVAFTVGGLGMIGLPPLAGFVSKWDLALGAVEAGREWALVVLLLSAGLNALYFLPPIYRGWFGQRREPWPELRRDELRAWLIAPPLVTAALTVAAGVFAAADYSAHSWAVEIVTRSYFR
jgi:multicomponent Na+:H+ antiporter subunit D